MGVQESKQDLARSLSLDPGTDAGASSKVGLNISDLANDHLLLFQDEKNQKEHKGDEKEDKKEALSLDDGDASDILKLVSQVCFGFSRRSCCFFDVQACFA